MPPNENYFVSEIEVSNKLDSKFDQAIVEEKMSFLLERGSNFHYSIFVKNNSNDTLEINTQDYSLFLIQEAKNINGEWQPAEYWVASDCGNSYITKSIKPNGILQWDSKGYNGYRRTEIRFRILINNKIYYTNSIKGDVKPNQLIIPPDISKVWPLRMSPEKIPEQIIKDVVFLEPDGNKKFMNFINNKKGQ